MSSDTTSKSYSVTPFTEDEQHVAGNAHNFFKAGQFDATVGILKKLQKSHSSDARVLHNKALTEFCKSGKTKVADFRKSLSKIQKILQQLTKEDDDLVTSGEKTSYGVLNFNQALLLYNMHQYSEAEKILEHLYENWEMSEDLYMLKVCLLLAETHLATYNAEKSGNVITVIEKTFLNSEEINSNQKSGNNEEKAKATSVLTSSEAESLRAYLRILRVRHFLQLKSIKACKREMKLLQGVGGQTPAGSQHISAAAVTSLFLKSNFEYVRTNYHKAYKLLGSCPPPYVAASEDPNHCSQETVPTMYYNNLAVIHFNLNKHNLGTFYMQKALQENEVAVTTLMKQHQQSISRHQQQQSAKPIAVLHMNRRYELLYNCGIILLHAGRSSAAFECLIAVVPAYHSNPRLWLRLAECCIQKCTGCGSFEETPSKAKAGKKTHSFNPAIFTVIGAGMHRKVVVNALPTSVGGRDNNVVMPAPTFEFASVCLNNARIILQQAVQCNDESGIGKRDQPDQQKPNGTKGSRSPLQCLPGAPVSGDDVTHLYGSVLANSAFVALQLGNGLLALHHCQTLLSLPKLSGCHRYLGHMYAADALVALDRISEAIQYLIMEKIPNISTNLGGNGKSSSDEGNQHTSSDNIGQSHRHKPAWPQVQTPHDFPPNMGCAHAYLMFNLATSHCLRSEFEKAQRLLHHASSLSPQQTPPQAVLLAVYLCLNGRGGALQALQILKRNNISPPSSQAVRAINGAGHRPFAAVTAGNAASSSGGLGSDISVSSNNRLKANIQPQGGATQERGGKGKSEKAKRNRR